ncbi:hypothetical protein AKJ09_05883 [Labilithrix luteola]|uniref:DUF3224 domain-containing protein n=1 Tax=Labilithrix luteola TaxID=1391654 RepID=A0A0K1Q1F1_9BACT|nr:hypothetical protein [Labilithrix luteola]AKU99219.1 hypothetical protein AKJ09_05883 [Labilithrix luteola]
MLGEKIGEYSGKITSMRVLAGEPGLPSYEASMVGSGKLLGVDGHDQGTYTAIMTSAGFFKGEGRGVFMSKDGDVITWEGYGRGRRTGPAGGMSWRGCTFYSTTSSKLSRLNGMACAFEFETEEGGGIRASLFEWR